MADDHKKHPDHDDFIKIGGSIGGGWRPYLRHRPDCTWEAGVGRVAKEGEAIPESLADNMMFLSNRREGNVYDVTEIAAGESSGPAQVATPAFRSGWDRIFGGEPTVGQA